MNEVLIRKAELKDLETLLQFEQGVISAERPFDETLKPDPINYCDMTELITAPHVYLIVAEFNNELIGSGYARIENSKPYNRHEQHAYLGFMYVVPSFRGKGVNGLIIKTLKEWTIWQGLNEMRLNVYDNNESAIKAYEKVGFSKHMIEMRMGL